MYRNRNPPAPFEKGGNLLFNRVHLRQNMTHLFFLGAKIMHVLLSRRNLYRNPLHYLYPVPLDALYLFRVIGHKAHLSYSQIEKYLRAYAVLPEVGLKTQTLVSLDGIHALILQRVGLNLISEPYAAAFLMHV